MGIRPGGGVFPDRLYGRSGSGCKHFLAADLSPKHRVANRFGGTDGLVAGPGCTANAATLAARWRNTLLAATPAGVAEQVGAHPVTGAGAAPPCIGDRPPGDGLQVGRAENPA